MNEDIPVVIQFLKNCDYETMLEGNYFNTIEANRFVLVQTNITFIEIKQLEKTPCVERTFRVSELDDVLEELQAEFDSERDEKFRELQLNRSVLKADVTDQDELKKYLEEKREAEAAELEGGIISEYQLYVTPEADAVVSLVAELGSDIQDIYDESLSWIWVSEEYLNGELEFWYYPQDFLTLTPDLANNPSLGEIASDCSEQANTLVSLLIAAGHSPEDVRVVLGLVDFGGSIGGHAWAEIYENNRWFALEATAGAYYDDDLDSLTEASSVPYTYFRYHSFPVETVWYYYNNEYFKEIGGTSNAPDHWDQEGRSYLRDDLESFEGQRPSGKLVGKV
tara:strand:- start:606 stop:1616 length:1011 start_codon:yes stop_codon:yes gene_type:complete